MTYQTAEEVLGSYVEKMGNELGPVFHHCRQKFIATTRVWDIYCVLFGNRERVDLLNRSSGFVAMHLHWQFLGGTILGLLRLLDPPATMGKPNLTLQSLPNLVSDELSSDVADRVKSLLNSCNGLKKVRDKILAHNDFGRATGDDEPLEIESRKVISEIIHVQAIIERATYSQLLKMSCNKLLTI